MNTTLIRNALVGLGLIVAIVLIAWLVQRPSTTQGPITTTSTPQATATARSISDSVITIPYSSENFGLAVSPEQIMVHAYIPPCGSDFNYCFYYVGSDYQGTNFESAGLRVNKRADLATQTQCLQTLPDGYTNLTPTTSTSATFATSIFSPLGDAAAGHYASGTLYRLAYQGSCYEFETRIGATQYANYPRGTIEEFMPSDQRAMEAKLLQLLKDMTLPSGVKPFSTVS